MKIENTTINVESAKVDAAIADVAAAAKANAEAIAELARMLTASRSQNVYGIYVGNITEPEQEVTDES